MIQKGKYLFVNAISEKIVFFILFILIARNFSAEIFGLTVTLFVFSNIVNVVLDLGMSSHFQRSFALTLRNYREELSIALKLRIIFLPVCLTAAAFYFDGNDNVDVVTVIAAAGGLFMMHTNHLLRSVFYGMELYEEIIVPHLGSVLFLLSAGSLCLTAEILWLFACALMISPLIEFFCLMLKLGKKGISFFTGKRTDYKQALMLVIKSLPFGIGIISVMLYDRADVLLIEKMLTPQSVAVYAAAYSLYKIPHQLFVPFLMPLYTEFSREFGFRGNADIVKTRDTIITIMIYSIGCILICNIAGEFLIELFYGGTYSASAELLKILSLALPFILLNNFTGILLNSLNMEKSVRNIVGAGAFINISLNLLLIPALGIPGAVLVTVTTELLILIFQSVKLLSLKKLFTIKAREDEYYFGGSLFSGDGGSSAG